MTVVWLVSCFNQSAVQRISALKSLGDAKKSYLLNIPLNALYGIILVLTGILLYAYVITIGCDPYQAGLINNTNQMMPYFVIHLLSNLPGMAGLYMSMLFSGALSTFSSGINSLAANTVEDLLAKCFRKYKDAQVTTAAKFIVVLYGAVSIGLAYLLKSLEGPVSQMAVSAFGACGGPILGMFFLGGAFPRGNKYGAFCGGVFGLGVSLWITIGSRLYGSPMRTLPPGPTYNCHLNDTASLVASNMTDLYTSTTATVLNSTLTTQALSDSYGPFSIYDISYLWIGPIGMIVSFLSGVQRAGSR
nr:hypothetical protein BaRGS_018407 [Batillaria attramentaria]